MPDKRKHRGPHPGDGRFFKGEVALRSLKKAAEDLGHLLDRGYALPSSLQLVGNRYRLYARQRLALMRVMDSFDSIERAKKNALDFNFNFEKELKGSIHFWVDTFNQVITLETALGGGILLQGRDGLLRDISAVHGHYRQVLETPAALQLLLKKLATFFSHNHKVTFLLDRPVSNSVRLGQSIISLLEERGRPAEKWQVEWVDNVDNHLKKHFASIGSWSELTTEVVITSDRELRLSVPNWMDMATSLILNYVPSPWILSLF